MSDKTLAALIAATPATGGLIYGTQGGADRKFTLTAAGAAVIEATTAPGGIKATVVTESTTLTAEQCCNGVVYVSAPSYSIITLPPPQEGMSVTVIAFDQIVIQLDTPSGYNLRMESGASVGQGNPTQSPGVIGDKAVVTFFDSETWYASTNGWSSGA